MNRVFYIGCAFYRGLELNQVLWMILNDFWAHLGPTCSLQNAQHISKHV